MSKTKGELVNAAFRKAKISGITTTPTGDELAGAVETLEDMMRELTSKNVNTTYTFEDSPNLSTDSNLAPEWYHAVQSRLAVLLCSDFGVEPGNTLMAQARQSWSSMIGKLTPVTQNGQPRRMPRGSGNTFRFPTWARYYYTDNRAPIDDGTIQIKDGETTNVSVSFETYLTGTESISSFTVTETTGGITIDSSAINGSDIDLTVTGDVCGAQSTVLTITTSIGRIYPLKVWFSVSAV